MAFILAVLIKHSVSTVHMSTMKQAQSDVRLVRLMTAEKQLMCMFIVPATVSAVSH